MGKARHAKASGADSSSDTFDFRRVIEVSEASTSGINIRDHWNTILCKAIAEEKDQLEKAWLRSQII